MENVVSSFPLSPHVPTPHKAAAHLDEAAPVVHAKLADLPLPRPLRTYCDKNGLVTVGDLIDLVDRPDPSTGRPYGLRLLERIPHLGEQRVRRVDALFVALGVDLTRGPLCRETRPRASKRRVPRRR